MDEIITRVAGAAGIGPETARKAIAIMLDLIVKEAPADKVAPLFAALPGAEALAGEGSGGGGIMGAFGGGLMAAYGKLTDAGLDTDQMRATAETLFAAAREEAGEEVVGEVVKSIPGLANLV